ncbi:MAG: hypothetical protein HY748_10020 [Elusimicrobia bacterium]|nr:hypothetical protein [Elusimicrobiota bacterium]
MKITAYLLAGAGALTSALPNMGKPLYKGWMGVAFVIATVVSNAVIALIFYGLITPMALVFKVLGRDCLRLKRGEGSHWVPVTMPADAERYERTF